MIVTLANAKGGVAKTTSAMFLAAAWVRRYPTAQVTVLDADPQSSASLWADLIVEQGEQWQGVDVQAANLSTLRRARTQAAAQGARDIVIVDAPPQGALLAQSMSVADFVMIPTSDTPLDVQQAWATASALPAGTPYAVLLVRAEPHTRAYRATVQALDEQHTPRFDTTVLKRQEIKQAMGHIPQKLYEYTGVVSELVGVLDQLRH